MVYKFYRRYYLIYIYRIYILNSMSILIIFRYIIILIKRVINLSGRVFLLHRNGSGSSPLLPIYLFYKVEVE